MPEILTDLKLETDERYLRTIKVPFTENEITTLRTARGIQDAWWQIGKSGSGWHRNLTTDLSIPWGTMLLDKEAAKEDAATCFKKIQDLLEKPNKNEDLVSLEEDLKKIADCLVKVFPKIAEEQKPPPTP